MYKQMMARVVMWHMGLRLVTVKFVTLSIIKGITQTCYRFVPNIKSNIVEGTYPSEGCDTRPVPCKRFNTK